MNIDNAIETLREHNKWRRGDDQSTPTDPVELGHAIDLIIAWFDGRNQTFQNTDTYASITSMPKVRMRDLTLNGYTTDWRYGYLVDGATNTCATAGSGVKQRWSEYELYEWNDSTLHLLINE